MSDDKEIHVFGDDGQGCYKVYSEKMEGGEHWYTINRYSDDGELLETFCLFEGEVMEEEDDD